MKQRTIRQEVALSGVGLHTGEAVVMIFKPADVHHGVKFKRTDVDGAPVIPADLNKVGATNRGTTLGHENALVHTVEHTLSALAGLEIDNVLIEINGSEVPILDGSAAELIRALLNAGIVEQEADREYFRVMSPVAYRDEASGVEFLALPADDFSITVLIDFNSPVLGKQYASLDRIGEFEKEIAPSRTFVFLHELEYLLAQNLIKGGDLDNAIVIADGPMGSDQLDALAKKLGKQSVAVEKEGILNTTALRFSNEPARHKLLDVIGDLSLIGKPFKGKIIATRPGHTANVAFARILKKHFLDHKKLQGVPVYDPNKPPLLTTTQIARKLPHRYPFLLVDKIIELTETRVVGVKNITMNEPYFVGHFPDNPVMPGVLQLEAMAQTGGILALANVPDGEVWDTYFLKIDNCKFRDKATPGDTLILKLELMEPIRRGIVHMQATAYVGAKVVSEAELTALIQKRTS